MECRRTFSPAAGPARWVRLLGLTAGVHAAIFCLTVGWDGELRAWGGQPNVLGLEIQHPEAWRAPETVPVERQPPISTLPRRDAPARPSPVPACTPRPPELASASAHVPACEAEHTRFHVATSDLTPTAPNCRDACVRPADTAARADPGEQPLSIGTLLAAPTNVPSSLSPGADPQGDPYGGLELPGKPVYPLPCRRGDCRGGRPCEGTSRWRITVPQAGAPASRIELLQSAGCPRLDQSARAYLERTPVPRAGVFTFRCEFRLDEGR